MNQLKHYTESNLSELQADLKQAEDIMIEAQNIFYNARRELVRLQNIRNDIWWQKIKNVKLREGTPF